MSPTEKEFVVGVAELANRLGITPEESMCLFGVLAASLASSDMKSGTPRAVALDRVSNLFAASFQRAAKLLTEETLQ